MERETFHITAILMVSLAGIIFLLFGVSSLYSSATSQLMVSFDDTLLELSGPSEEDTLNQLNNHASTYLAKENAKYKQSGESCELVSVAKPEPHLTETGISLMVTRESNVETLLPLPETLKEDILALSKNTFLKVCYNEDKTVKSIAPQ